MIEDWKIPIEYEEHEIVKHNLTIAQEQLLIALGALRYVERHNGAPRTPPGFAANLLDECAFVCKDALKKISEV